MKREIICMIGSILNGILFVFWVIIFVTFPIFEKWILMKGKWTIVLSLMLAIFCLVIGKCIFKLDLECLFLKYEIAETTRLERNLLRGAVSIFLCTCLFTWGSVVVYNALGIAMSEGQKIRHALIPWVINSSSVAGTACVLAYKYYQIIK